MAKTKSRAAKGATAKVALKRKLIKAEQTGRSLTAADIKVVVGSSRAATSGLLGRTPKRIHDADRRDNITWIDGDGRDHTQTIDMDTKDVGKRNIP